MNSENVTKEIVANKVQSSTRKVLRNRGESYTSTAGKHVPARVSFVRWNHAEKNALRE